MRHASTSLAALVLAVGILSGCGKSAPTDPNDSSGEAQDQSEVSGELANSPEYVDDGVYESEDVTEATLEAGTAAEVEANQELIHPLNFWRRITDVRRRFEFAFSDPDTSGRPTRAIVTVHKQLTGTFNIAVAGPEDGERQVIHKRLRDNWTRRIALRRVRVPESARLQWKIVATSGIQVVSEPVTTDLVSLRVQGGSVDTTITDPLAFFHLRRVLRFAPEDTVVVIATTLRSDDVVVLQKRDRRIRFHNNGDNTYTGRFRVGFIEGVHHVGVNVLSRGTLFDSEAPYDSEAWILPFVTRPIELAFTEP